MATKKIALLYCAGFLSSSIHCGPFDQLRQKASQLKTLLQQKTQEQRAPLLDEYGVSLITIEGKPYAHVAWKPTNQLIPAECLPADFLCNYFLGNDHVSLLIRKHIVKDRASGKLNPHATLQTMLSHYIELAGGNGVFDQMFCHQCITHKEGAISDLPIQFTTPTHRATVEPCTMELLAESILDYYDSHDIKKILDDPDNNTVKQLHTFTKNPTFNCMELDTRQEHIEFFQKAHKNDPYTLADLIALTQVPGFSEHTVSTRAPYTQSLTPFRIFRIPHLVFLVDSLLTRPAAVVVIKSFTNGDYLIENIYDRHQGLSLLFTLKNCSSFKKRLDTIGKTYLEKTASRFGLPDGPLELILSFLIPESEQEATLLCDQRVYDAFLQRKHTLFTE